MSFLIGLDGKIVHVTDSGNPDVHLAEMKEAIAGLKKELKKTLRYQLFPGAFQRQLDSDDGWKQDVHLGHLDFLKVSGADLGAFGKLVLGQTLG